MSRISNDASMEIRQSAPKIKFRVKEPFKLIGQMIYFFIAFFPFILWAMVSSLFTRKKCIRDKVVLITGAGRGLGRGLAMKFANLGCKVACADVDEVNNLETVRLIKQKYPDAVASAYRCNVGLVDDIKFLSKTVATDMGEVEILVNNAGLVSGAKMPDIQKSYLDIVVDVNLKSHFLMIQEFLPKMIQRNSGHIVAIASLAGLNGLANASVYSATKHGLIGMMESLYDELRNIPKNQVQTTCICPYFIRTNEMYCKEWDLRLPELTVNEVTSATIAAVLKNKRITAVPSILYSISIMTRLLPDNLRNLSKEIFYTRFTIPEKEANNIDAIMADTVNRGTRT